MEELMTAFQSIILGFIQSLTEFLPISSSAHLYLLPWFFKFTTPGRAFDIALHLGTALAILIYFHKDFYNMLKTRKLAIAIIVATLPAIAFGFFIAKLPLRNPLISASCLIIFGILLYIFDKKSQSDLEMKNITLKQALIIGFAQVLAMVPGVSRSGVTITTARGLKITRQAAAKFSFFMAVPVIFGAVILDIKEITNIINIEFFIGFFTSFLIGLLTIKFFLMFIKNHNFKVFMVYRIVLAILIFWFYTNFQG